MKVIIEKTPDSFYVKCEEGNASNRAIILAVSKTKHKALESALTTLGDAYSQVCDLSEGKKKKT